MPSQAFTVFALQLLAFALLAFPARTLVDSFRVALGGRGEADDAPEMAVGVFAALGRAGLAAGLNGALLAAAYTAFFLPEAQRFAAAVRLIGAFATYGVLFRVLVALPLEALAFRRAR